MVIFYRKIEQSAFKYLMNPRLMMNKEKQILLFVVLLEAMLINLHGYTLISNNDLVDFILLITYTDVCR